MTGNNDLQAASRRPGRMASLVSAWHDNLHTWRMCREGCHELGWFCWFPVHAVWARVHRPRKLHKVIYSETFVSSLLDVQRKFTIDHVLLDRIGTTFAELELEAQLDDFQSEHARAVWLTIGDDDGKR